MKRDKEYSRKHKKFKLYEEDYPKRKKGHKQKAKYYEDEEW